VTNTGSVPLGAPQALACVDPQPMETRADLAALPSTNPEDCAGTKESIDYEEFPTALAPEGKVQFSLSIAWDKWQISDRAGVVYLVGVYFRASVEGARDTIGRVRTLMPVVTPAATPRKVQTAMVLPLRHRPTQLGGDLFANESLAASMAPTGRLGRQLAAGTAPKVTWLADPSMLDEARRLQDGYELLKPDKSAFVPGSGSQIVRNWLDRFDKVRGQDPVVLLPYGDPDVGSLVDNDLKDLVTASRERTAGFSLGSGPAPLSGLWLEAGSATGKNLVAGTTGYAKGDSTELTLVSNWSWPVAERPVLTPSPVLNIATPEGPVKSTRAIVYDAALTAGGPDPDTAATPIQMRQRFAAETALLAATPGSGPLTVVALPPRGFDPSGVATQALLQGLDLPWITQVGLDQVAAAAPRPAATPTMPRSSPGLNERQVERIGQLNRLLDTYGSLVSNREAALASLSQYLLRSSSTSWRGWLQHAEQFLTYQVGAVNGQLRRVHLTAGANGSNSARPIQVTLSGRSGRFPLTVTNDLDQSVRVGLKVTSTNRSDLRIEPIATITLPANQKGTFNIVASAEQNGFIQARVQVVTADGAPVGPQQDLVIQAAQYGDVGWIFVGSAVALLFGTSLIRIYRRIRTERRNSGTTAAQPGPTPEQPDAPAAETTPAPAGVPAQNDVRAPNGVPAESDTPATVREEVGRTDG